jgi:hypothetical protein
VQSRRVAAGVRKLLAAVATLQLPSGLLSVLDYVFEENVWPLAFRVLDKTGSCWSVCFVSFFQALLG